MLFSRIINNKVSKDLIRFAQLWFATKFQALKSFAYISHQFNVWLTFYIRKQHVLQLIEHISQRVDLRICRFVYTYVDSFSFSFILEFSTHRFSCFLAMHEAWQMPNNILFFSFFPFSFNVKRTHAYTLFFRSFWAYQSVFAWNSLDLGSARVHWFTHCMQIMANDDGK